MHYIDIGYLRHPSLCLAISAVDLLRYHIFMSVEAPKYFAFIGQYWLLPSMLAEWRHPSRISALLGSAGGLRRCWWANRVHSSTSLSDPPELVQFWKVTWISGSRADGENVKNPIVGKRQTELLRRPCKSLDPLARVR